MRLCNFSYGEDSRTYVQALSATSARSFGFSTKPRQERTSTQTGKAQAGLGWRTGRVQRKIYLHETAKRILELVGRLSYLVDSNVWLELLLEQERAEEVRQFLSLVQLGEPRQRHRDIFKWGKLKRVSQGRSEVTVCQRVRNSWRS